MSRNGAGVYTLPPGSTVSNGDISDATDVNTPFSDLETDMNTPRPVVAGGTGASSAAAALVNLGLTATAAELNIMDGVTASAAELNILDGATLTVTELNYVDGATSSIQTQLNTLSSGKQDTITQLPLANGGTGAALADPGADRIMFWDDSAGAVAFLTAGTGLSISGTTMTTTAGWTLVSNSSTWTGGKQTITGLGSYRRVMVALILSTADTADERILKVGDAGGILGTSIYQRNQGTARANAYLSHNNVTAELSGTMVIENFNTTEPYKPIINAPSRTNDTAVGILTSAVLTQIEVSNETGNITGGQLIVWGEP